jgi:hypothetical protein
MQHRAMKLAHFLLGAAILTAFSTQSVFALDWESARRNPAEVTVVNCEPMVLAAGEGPGQFLKVPTKLEGARIFVEASGKKVGNTADFTVVKEGWLLVAADYSYQGNSSGDWDEKRWSEKEFKKNGWEMLAEKQMGGLLIDKGNKEWKVFAKRVRPKDSNRLITNKYGYPKLIVLAADKKP